MTPFEEFVQIIARLRAPDGCPWDRAQTPQTLRRYLLEEAYEALEAIDLEDPRRLKEELGDLLLQIVLQSQIAGESGQFTIYDVIAHIHAKMIRRHPHVFGDQQGATVEQIAAIVLILVFGSLVALWPRRKPGMATVTEPADSTAKATS